MIARFFQSRRHSHNCRDIFRTRTLSTFLSAAFNQACQWNPFSHIQSPDTFRTVKFVRRKRQHINILLLYIDVQMSCRLNRISMEYYAFCSANFADFLYRLNRADFIVDIHHSNKASVFTNGLLHLFGQDKTVFVNIKKRYFKSFIFQFLQGMQNCVMLECGRNNVFLAFSRTDFGSRKDCLIIRLTATGSKCNFIRSTAKTLCDPFSRICQRFGCGLSGRVQTGRIAVNGIHIR